MIRNIFTNFSARLGGAALSFFMLLLTTYMLGSEVRGEISILQLSITIIHLVSDLAGGPSLVYLVPRTRLRTLIAAGSAWGILSTFATGFILLWAHKTPANYGTEIFIIGVLISLYSLNQNILLGQQRIKAYNILYIVQSLIQFTTMAISIFVFKQQQAYPFLYACYAGYGICYLIGLVMISRNAPAPQITEKRPVLLVLFANGFFTQAASLFLMLNMLKNYTSLQEHFGDTGNHNIGVFSTSFALAEAILLFAGSVSAIVLAKVSNETDHTKARATIFRLSKLSFGLTFCAVAFFLLLPPGFYSYLIGGAKKAHEFTQIKTVFVTLVPGVLCLSFGTVYSHYFSGAGKHYMNFISGILALITTYLVSVFFVERLGIRGAGISASLSYIVLTVVIFTAFLLMGKNTRDDLKLLIPDLEDFLSLRNLWKKQENNPPAND